jgi:AmiR/NasT family two-component response regulator
MNDVRPPAPAKVLIVEDEAAIAMEIEMLVSAMGYIVVGPAASCERALELAERERPDIALMDINISGNRDGVETAGHLRSRYDLPVIFTTAYSNAETVSRAKGSQPQGWLLKPFSERELRITLDLSLQRLRTEQRLKETNQQLMKALAEVKMLSGLLPICLTCKKIRDGQNTWHPLEVYITRHSEAKFSHGYCPVCLSAFLLENGLDPTPGTPE